LVVGSGSASLAQIAAFLQDQYKLVGEISRLPGENENYRIEEGEGKEYILKLSGENLNREALELDRRIVEHLRKVELNLSVPHTIPNQLGHPLSRAVKARRSLPA
jgi:Ser/Thr protein kinase RdoA (MazF antagonist)